MSVMFLTQMISYLFLMMTNNHDFGRFPHSLIFAAISFFPIKLETLYLEDAVISSEKKNLLQ